MSKLVDGLIPKHTECPFKEECGMPSCIHEGVNHNVDFSCALARAWDIVDEAKERKANAKNV